MAELRVCVVAWVLASTLACGPGAFTVSGSEEDTGSTSTASTSDESSDSEDTDEPQPCMLTALESFDINALVDGETEVRELEVLDSGEVLVAGGFGLARRQASGGAFELIDAPPLLSTVSIRLQRGPARELWASSNDDLAHTGDAGETWDSWTFHPGGRVHRIVDMGGVQRIYLGGDAQLGVFAAGEVSWTTIDVLDGDTDHVWENNAIMSLVLRDDRLLAVENFGRMAVSIADGPWTAVDAPLTDDPELLDLGNRGVLLLSRSGELFHSDDGLAWTPRGLADGWPEFVGEATQLAYRPLDGALFAAGNHGLQASCDLGASWVTIPLGTESEVIDDVSVGLDGSLWAAGFQHVHRMGP